MANLTEKTIPTLQIPPGSVRLRVQDDRQPGLYLTIGARTRTWELKRKNRWTRLGSWPALSVAAARQQALEVLARLDTGRPIGLTLDSAHTRWLRQKERSPLTLQGAEDMLRLYFSDWRTRPLEDFTREEVERRHLRITKDAGPGSANNAMRLFRALWNVAMRVDPALPVSPTIAIMWNRPPRIDESQLYDRLGEWWQRVGTTISNPARVALYRLALLTGLRANDLRTMRWEHVQGGTLRVPSPKGGTGRAFSLPLLDAHMAQLDAARAATARPGVSWVFPAASGTGHMMDLGLSARETRAFSDLPWTPHSLRRCYLSAATEAGLSEFEMALLVNHTPGGTTFNYVARHMDSRPAMERVVARLFTRLALC